jgi:L-alanine-DL-glutamate epimerase-like enolase superfamily enzyme
MAEDVARLSAVREAVGDSFEIMVDANQCFTLSEALRRAPHYADLDIAWFEEPLPADDLTGHARLARGHVDAHRGGRVALLADAFPRLRSARPAPSCRPTWRASAASRPG